jgi:hypothetical protein
VVTAPNGGVMDCSQARFCTSCSEIVSATRYTDSRSHEIGKTPRDLWMQWAAVAVLTDPSL